MSERKELIVQPKKTVSIRGEYELVPTNQNLQMVANRLRWKPETAITRIKRALPSPMEQQIYLAIAPLSGEICLLPESMAKLLRLYLGNQHLQLEDLSPGSSGRSRFNNFADFLGECINLLRNVTKEFRALSIRIVDAGEIVLLYGKDNPERLIEMVDCNLEEMCEALDISNHLSYRLRMNLCIQIVVKKIIPQNHRNGTPDLLDLTDFLNMPSARRENLKRVLHEEMFDALEEDRETLLRSSGFELLKELF